MTFETQSIAGTVTQHPTFKSAWDLHQQSLTKIILPGETTSALITKAGIYYENFIWNISFDDGIYSHQWIYATIPNLLECEDEANQTCYLNCHEDDVKQRGVPALMEEISQRRIQAICELSEPFADALESQEMDRVFWIDQPIEPEEYNHANGFFRIIDVLTEDEFKARYYS